MRVFTKKEARHAILNLFGLRFSREMINKVSSINIQIASARSAEEYLAMVNSRWNQMICAAFLVLALVACISLGLWTKNARFSYASFFFDAAIVTWILQFRSTCPCPDENVRAVARYWKTVQIKLVQSGFASELAEIIRTSSPDIQDELHQPVQPDALEVMFSELFFKKLLELSEMIRVEERKEEFQEHCEELIDTFSDIYEFARDVGFAVRPIAYYLEDDTVLAPTSSGS